MKKKLAVIALAGMMMTGLTAGSVQAAELGGEVYVLLQPVLPMQWKKYRRILTRNTRM